MAMVEAQTTAIHKHLDTVLEEATASCRPEPHMRLLDPQIARREDAQITANWVSA